MMTGNSLDKQYQDLLKTILEFGIEKRDRTGVGTKSIFGYTIRHNMQEGFPALTTKKLFFKGVVGELIWFLRGDTNLRYLLENDIHIWTGDAYKKYEKWFESLQQRIANPQTSGDRDAAQFVDASQMKKLTMEEFESEILSNVDFNQEFGNLGPIYGKQWRDWFHGNWWMNGSRPMTTEKHIDQIADAIKTLKENPDSRRIIVSAWNVGEIDSMTLPPCHSFFQFYTRELTLEERVQYGNRNNMWRLGQTISELHCDALRIPKRAVSLMWYQRSVDTLLGLPFNIASYGLLLEIIGKMVNMMPDQLIGNLGDTHLYLNHLEQAKEQIGREMTFEEKVQWVMKNTDVEMENLYITEEVYKPTTPTHTRQPFPLPKLKFNKIDSFFRDGDINLVSENLSIQDFELENYQHHKTIKAPLNN